MSCALGRLCPYLSSIGLKKLKTIYCIPPVDYNYKISLYVVETLLVLSNYIFAANRLHTPVQFIKLTP